MTQIMQNCIVLAVLFLIIAIPLYFVSRKARINKQKKIAGLLSKTAMEHQLYFQFVDHLDAFTLALDHTKNILVRFDFKEEQPELFDLKDIRSCKLTERKQGRQVHLLELLLLDQYRTPRHSLVFYRQFQDNELNLKRTLQAAASWEKRINQSIRQIAL
jgi:hypothetical protein